MQQQGRRDRWPLAAGWQPTRADLLHALDAYRRGVAEAPVVCKWMAQPTGPGDAPVGPPRRSALVKDSSSGGPDRGQNLTFVASNAEVDRHGDTVSLDGWRLDEYRLNPVVLWAHDYRQPAIGVTEDVWNDGRALLARIQFAPTAFAKEVEGLYRQGYQRGVSVGFRPVRFEERRDLRSGAFLGIQFLEQELLEISAVPVPANSRALLNEGSGEVPATPMGAVVSLLREWRGEARASRDRCPISSGIHSIYA